MNKKILLIFLGIIIVAVGAFFVLRGSLFKGDVEQAIELDGDLQEQAIADTSPQNAEGLSPITGLPCDNWNRRPVAVMQASDVPARPASGFSQADMVIEMPVITASVTRLMGIYICNTPEQAGSMRSARHDFVHLAKGLDAIFVHWGRSEIESFITNLNDGVIDNFNCNNDAGRGGGAACFRDESFTRGVDSGHVRVSDIMTQAAEAGYRTEGNFSGYPHQDELPLDQRRSGGNLRVGFAGDFGVNYSYDKETNSYKRIWGRVVDIDRANEERHAPKNIVVMMAESEQIEGQYNNVQLGDPWFDDKDSGEAFYYFNGEEERGRWVKDKRSIDSKLQFLNGAGENVKFVPGQIWVEILEPGQNRKWTPFPGPNDAGASVGTGTGAAGGGATGTTTP